MGAPTGGIAFSIKGAPPSPCVPSCPQPPPDVGPLTCCVGPNCCTTVDPVPAYIADSCGNPDACYDGLVCPDGSGGGGGNGDGGGGGCPSGGGCSSGPMISLS